MAPGGLFISTFAFLGLIWVLQCCTAMCTVIWAGDSRVLVLYYNESMGHNIFDNSTGGVIEIADEFILDGKFISSL